MRIADRVERLLERSAPTHGIRPVPDDARALSGRDLAVLWGDLSVGVLVLVTGALLVPSLGLPAALLAIAVGAALGCGLLALVGLAGQREGVPGMVLFRPALGARGSYLPSLLNLVQLIGWTAVEFWAMATVANVASSRYGFDAFHGWLVLVAGLCTLFAIGGPVAVVRRWLERFGIQVLVVATAAITFRLLAVGDVASLWVAPGTGGLPFWLAVDLVVVMPVSWLPLVADYTRFARRDARGFAGVFGGSFVGTAWFYALGALIVLAAGAGTDLVGIGTAVIAVAGGPIVLAALLVGETDNAFANLYSSVVSTQNLAPRVPQRRLTLALGVGAALWTALTLKLHWFQHPKLHRTEYRVPGHGWEELPKKFALPDFSIQVELQHARQQVWMRLEGALSSAHAESLVHRIQESLARGKHRLVLDLNKLHWDKVDDLQPLRDKLAAYRGRIRLIAPKLSAAHPELILLAAMFQHYKG